MDVGSLCAALVKIRSENPPGDTTDIAHYVQGFLDEIGIMTTLVPSPGGRTSVVSQKQCHPLLLCGHLDTVPALPEGWRHPPFSGDIVDGYVWGRGATDMKGGCAAIMWALHTLCEEGGEPCADVLFVADEETSGTYGVVPVLERGLISACDCLLAEPTPDRYASIGQKGLCRLDLHFKGDPCHGSLYPAQGVSAIMEAYSLLTFLEEVHTRRYAPPAFLEKVIKESSAVLEAIFGIAHAEEVLTQVMYNPGTIKGGEKANVVAQHCDLSLDIRLPWGCDPAALIKDIELRANRATVTTSAIAAPSLTPPDAPVVQTTLAAIERVCGAPATPFVQWAASDARHLRAAGFSVVEYGPGEISTLHAVGERVSLASLENATAVYCNVIRAYSDAP